MDRVAVVLLSALPFAFGGCRCQSVDAPPPEPSGVPSSAAVPMASTPVSNGSWSIRLGGSGVESGLGLCLRQDGRLFVVGTTTDGSGDRDILVAALVPTGAVLWERRLGGPGSDVSISIGARGDEVALVGTTAGNEGVVLLLRPGDGTTKWNRQLGRELWSMPEVALGSDGSVLVVGSTWSPLRPEPKPDQVFVVKLDSEGSVLWESQFGAPEGDSGPSIALHPSGDAILVGLTGGWDSPTRALMRRMDSAGTISWTTNLGNREEDHLGPVAVNARGDAFVVGGSRVTAEVFSGVALKVDPKDGRIIWRRDFADPPRYPFVGVAASNAGVYALAAKGGTESEQFVVVELGDGGQVLWEAVVTPAGDATGIAADSRGNVFVVGTTPYDASSDHLSDIFVTKIVRPAG